MIWPDPTHQPTHPPTHQPNYTPIHGGKFSTDFKSWNGIEISWLVQVLLNFYWFWGSPSWGWWVGGWRWGGNGCVWCLMHACTHMHIHVKHDKHGCLHVSDHLQFLYMCLRVCAYMCLHVYMCGGTPTPYTSIHPPPPPRAARSPKHQNSISLELIEIFRFCWRFFTSEHSWTHIHYSWSPSTPPTTCPMPQSRENRNQKNYNNSWMNRDNSILFEDLGPLNPPAHI